MAIAFVQDSENRAHVEVLIDEAHVFTVDCYENDLPVALDATVTKVRVQKPGGTDLVAKTATGVTVAAGRDGTIANRITYTLTAAKADTLEENYVLTWYAVRNGETEEHERRVLFDVVTSKLYQVVNEEDMFQFAPGLRNDRAYRTDGTADASGGSTTTLVDERLKEFPDDWFNGGELDLINGADAGERREVTDFASSTGTVTFSPAISAAPDGDAYRVRRSWSSLIDLAFEAVKQRVRDRGNRPALIIDAGQLFRPVAFHAIELAYAAIGSMRGENPEGDESANWAMSRHYAGEYDEAFKAISFLYDSSEDGIPDTVVEHGPIKVARR